MTRNPHQYELILLGATGYTGKLTAEFINERLPLDLKWAIAGRNAKKLQCVVDELTEANPNREPPETVDLVKDQLDLLVRKTKLIITTVGPYMLYGEAVLAACAESGTSYLDCTGESPWYYDMVQKYQETALRNGAIIIPQCGLDSVPADVMTFVVANYIRKTFHAHTASVILSLYAFKSGFSGGTLSTMLNLFSHYSLAKLATAMEPYSLSPVRPNNPSAPPTSSGVHRFLGLRNISELGGTQTAGLMASVDTCTVHRSWGLYETHAARQKREELAYGPRFRFTEYMRARNLLHGTIFNLGLSLVGLLLAFPPSRWILSPLIAKFVIPAPGEGPSRESMKKDFMSYRALGIADTNKKEKVIGRLDTPHGGYMTTAVTLTAAAHLLLRGDLAGTEAGAIGGGILTPATLGERYVEQLKEFGIKIEVGQIA